MSSTTPHAALRGAGEPWGAPRPQRPIARLYVLDLESQSQSKCCFYDLLCIMLGAGPKEHDADESQAPATGPRPGALSLESLWRPERADPEPSVE